MTPASTLQSALDDLYLGRTIADYAGAPFVVRQVQVSDDCGELEVDFWSHQPWYPNSPPPGLQSLSVRQYGELPTILA